MKLLGRLRRLEGQMRGEPPSDLATIVDEAQAIRRWLAERQLTAEEALAAGLGGPPGMRVTSLAAVVEARKRAQEWRKSFEASNHAGVV
jgi:hypothetical protein